MSFGFQVAPVSLQGMPMLGTSTIYICIYMPGNTLKSRHEKVLKLCRRLKRDAKVHIRRNGASLSKLLCWIMEPQEEHCIG